MTPETITKIQEVLAPVAEKLGQGAEYGWEVLVAGQFAEGVAQLVVGIVMMIALITLTVLAVKWWKMAERSHDSRFAIALLTLAGYVFIGGAGTNFIYQGLIMTVAPEYAALKYLISLGQ